PAPSTPPARPLSRQSTGRRGLELVRRRWYRQAVNLGTRGPGRLQPSALGRLASNTCLRTLAFEHLPSNTWPCFSDTYMTDSRLSLQRDGRYHRNYAAV